MMATGGGPDGSPEIGEEAKEGQGKDAVKDAARRKRTSKTARLKQSKLDARREQWLSQISGGSLKGATASPAAAAAAKLSGGGQEGEPAARVVIEGMEAGSEKESLLRSYEGASTSAPGTAGNGSAHRPKPGKASNGVHRSQRKGSGGVQGDHAAGVTGEPAGAAACLGDERNGGQLNGVATGGAPDGKGVERARGVLASFGADTEAEATDSAVGGRAGFRAWTSAKATENGVAGADAQEEETPMPAAGAAAGTATAAARCPNCGHEKGVVGQFAGEGEETGTQRTGGSGGRAKCRGVGAKEARKEKRGGVRKEKEGQSKESSGREKEGKAQGGEADAVLQWNGHRGDSFPGPPSAAMAPSGNNPSGGSRASDKGPGVEKLQREGKAAVTNGASGGETPSPPLHTSPQRAQGNGRIRGGLPENGSAGLGGSDRSDDDDDDEDDEDDDDWEAAADALTRGEAAAPPHAAQARAAGAPLPAAHGRASNGGLRHSISTGGGGPPSPAALGNGNGHHGGAFRPEYRPGGGRAGNGGAAGMGRFRSFSANGRAWRPDDVERPETLPPLLSARSARHAGQAAAPSGGGSHEISLVKIAASKWHVPYGGPGRGGASALPSGPPPAPTICPICTEELDVTDSSFVPCSCGFRLCLFCHHRIAQDDGRCPGCRREYKVPDPAAAKLAQRAPSLWLRV